MREFCYECHCEYRNKHPKEKALIMSDIEGTCDICGQQKRIVLCYKRDFYYFKYLRLFTALKILLFPIFLIYLIVRKIRRKIKKKKRTAHRSR